MSPQKYSSREKALDSARGISGTASATVPTAFFSLDLANPLKQMATGQAELTREKGETVGGGECVVVSGQMKPKAPVLALATTLWIGKKDHLIHQSRTTMTMGTMPIPNTRNTRSAAAQEALQNVHKQMEGQEIVITQVHENIQVNQSFSKSDFAR